MSRIGDLIQSSKKIVVKIGSSTLSDPAGCVNRTLMHNIVGQLWSLMERDKKIILVSSGAGICGVGAINKWHRKGDINYKQALCAIGQVELMNAYKELFQEYGVHVGQMLLTREDFGEPDRNLHIRNTLFTLVDEGVVPIINENDSVSVDEIRIGDNDTLSALTANLWGADLLLILSDINGVYNADPKINQNAKLVEEVYDIACLQDAIDTKGVSVFGTGGITTKLTAAQMAGRYGIHTMIVNGTTPNILEKVMDGTEKGTLFVAG